MEIRTTVILAAILATVTGLAAVRVDILNILDPFGGVLLCGGLVGANWALGSDKKLNARARSLIRSDIWRARLHYLVHGIIIGACVLLAVWASSESIVDPEDERNKIVRVSRIEPWGGKGNYAILVEFAVTKIPTEGAIVQIALDRKPLMHDVRKGAPKRKDMQRTLANMSYEQNLPDLVQGTYVLNNPMSNHDVTPNTSIYHYFEADRPIEPVDILFFAVANNAEKIPSESISIGHAYRGWSRS